MTTESKAGDPLFVPVTGLMLAEFPVLGAAGTVDSKRARFGARGHPVVTGT